ncbi:MAG: DUF4166 domain-containing protein [Candidatus Microbacterium colombiense]|nr:MAG: DUF4166 domain-containing protein [Microbacterium sp.]
MTSRGEVFLAALGAEAERLHPEILAQMRVHADRDDVEGVFTVAGSRLGRLMALTRPVVGPGVCVTRFAHDVPFALAQTTGTSRAGRPTLDTSREFRFPGTTQYISDRLTVTPLAGVVHNALGVRGRVELLEECSVTADGHLRMRTRRVALRLAGRRLVLRGLFGVAVDLEDGWDEAHRRRTIQMRVRSPLLGTILEYRGWYRYADPQ